VGKKASKKVITPASNALKIFPIINKRLTIPRIYLVAL
jgi:hypothetical protein